MKHRQGPELGPSDSQMDRIGIRDQVRESTGTELAGINYEGSHRTA